MFAPISSMVPALDSIHFFLISNLEIRLFLKIHQILNNHNGTTAKEISKILVFPITLSFVLKGIQEYGLGVRS
jgi:hypothetical protein